ncbi:hypothetical protein NIASO_07125 [Niabella soli DSM 19437]|uniref:Uncharacterized protein n=1 Tax=Niabella soli DSM 19437 TaxID=929713 RepID=W0F309_9BACT|nr:hypothetical protein NIASO_07125 [Niabella soli DSM 19437]
MSPFIIFLAALLYVGIVVFGIRMIVRDNLLPPHLKVLAIIAVLIFNIIPVGIYFLIKKAGPGNR